MFLHHFCIMMFILFVIASRIASIGYSHLSTLSIPTIFACRLISFSPLQLCNHMESKTLKQPNRTKNYLNRYPHRIRKRECAGLIRYPKQLYPEEDTDNTKCETRPSDIQQRSLLCDEPDQRVEHTNKPLKKV